MALTLESALESLDRITVLWRATPEEKASYASMLMEAVGWMQPYQFDAVCKVLAQEAKSGRRIGAGSYVAVYRKLSQENGWGQKARKQCSSCGGIGSVRTRYLVIETGDEFDAVKPCPDCGTRRPLKDGLIEIDLETPPLKERWAKLSPDAKKAALGYGEALSAMVRKPEYLERFIRDVTTS